MPWRAGRWMPSGGAYRCWLPKGPMVATGNIRAEQGIGCGEGAIRRVMRPAWTGVIFPSVLSVGSIFAPGMARGFLLLVAAAAAACTFHFTDLGGKNWKRTGVAFCVFCLLAVGVFWLGLIVNPPSRLRR